MGLIAKTIGYKQRLYLFVNEDDMLRICTLLVNNPNFLKDREPITTMCDLSSTRQARIQLSDYPGIQVCVLELLDPTQLALLMLNIEVEIQMKNKFGELSRLSSFYSYGIALAYCLEDGLKRIGIVECDLGAIKKRDKDNKLFSLLSQAGIRI